MRSKSVVGDDVRALAEHFHQALGRVDVVVTTGGLGPTSDDLTREGVAEALGLPLVENEALVQSIRTRFERRGLTMPDANRRQAAVPTGARVLANPNGTAPGLWINAGDRIVVLLPGPPREMQPMFEREVRPELMARSSGRRVWRRSSGSRAGRNRTSRKSRNRSTGPWPRVTCRSRPRSWHLRCH